MKRKIPYTVEGVIGYCRKEGECLVWLGTCEKNRSCLPHLGRKGADERLVHRWLWKRLRPEEDINGWALTRKCSTIGCCNPEHYFKGCYNGGKYLRKAAEAAGTAVPEAPPSAFPLNDTGFNS